eukprot:TRINITY_DN2761_c0_g2_i1.p3 TRINITY_DN2761_c0_g2~~TRINITY_DN2761_c0_g2_i1.p3  ORF type:complete len:227 (+),score=46.37 TRINITY_DN2761_c0_g2_i1:1807-2487(+)
MQQRDANVAMGRYTFGRLHCLLRGSGAFEPAAVAAHAAVAPLVHAFFRPHTAEGASVFLSEAQLVVADPCAETQRWHLDSVGGPALTVLVPLSTARASHGPQAVLPASHHLHDRRLPLLQRFGKCVSALAASHGAQTLVAHPSASSAAAAAPDAEGCWAAGDALLLDSRLLHRGLPNESLGAPFALLVLRYDLTDSPPPGCGRTFLLSMARVGSVLEHMFKFYAAV